MSAFVAPRRLILTLAFAGLLAATRLAAQVPTPQQHFGFRMGDDGRLATASAIEQYFERVASRSDRVRIVDIGPTTEGHRTIAALVSAPENIANLAQIQAINQQLSDPRRVQPADARRLAAAHKAVLAIGCSIHASEIGASQAANELLFFLATSNDPGTVDILRNVVVVLIPMLNPDGHRLYVNWFERTTNTPFAGAAMPWLYHKYAGHDINRDAFMMNLSESRNLARFFYTEWHPQVFLSLHQMDSNGPRMFVPPVSDPIDRNYDPLIWREAALLGGAMALQLQRDRHSGVVSNELYDYFSPGYEDSAPLGHNVVCLLTEVASPSTGAFASLPSGNTRFSSTDAPRMNYPDPWPGGPWTLRDVIDYELSAARGLLQAVSAYRQEIVESFYDLGVRSVEQGTRERPFAFVIPPEQTDPLALAKLQDLLIQGGIDIHRAEAPFRAGGRSYPMGTSIIQLAQPYRSYVKTLLERQEYPARRQAAEGTADRPYDVTGWTLPVQMGIDVHTIEDAFDLPATSRLSASWIAPATVSGNLRPAAYVIDGRGNAGVIAINRLVSAGLRPSWITKASDLDGFRYAAGAVIVANSKATGALVERISSRFGLRAEGLKRALPQVITQPVGTPRIALYKPWLDIADEGWTRWLLEQYEFQFSSIADADVRSGNLTARFDVIILPDASVEQISHGNRPDSVPREYVGGLSTAGAAALTSFVEAGGTLIALGHSSAFAIDTFQLPVRDVTADVPANDFFCPGSLVRIELDPTHPVAYGMNPQTAAFFAFGAAYEVVTSDGDDRQTKSPRVGEIGVVASYGTSDLLLSGWLEGEQVIAGRPAVLDVRYGTGRIMLFGFSPQHRAQTHATFRLLFNAILTASQRK